MKVKLASISGLRRGVVPAIGALTLGCLTGCGAGTGSTSQPLTVKPIPQHILFVGDSFTHGPYRPVRT
jgi:hypothetical protein